MKLTKIEPILGFSQKKERKNRAERSLRNLNNNTRSTTKNNNNIQINRSIFDTFGNKCDRYTVNISVSGFPANMSSQYSSKPNRKNLSDRCLSVIPLHGICCYFIARTQTFQCEYAVEEKR